MMIRALIVLHILAGSVAVLGMFVAWLTEKGGRWHLLGGRTYVWSMTVTLILALLVSALTANVFLLLVSMFSGYFVYTGWRLANVKDGVQSAMDRNTCLLMLLVSMLMVTYGAYLLIQKEGMGVTLIVFGVFAAFPAWQDHRLDGTWPRGKQRIVMHLGRMGGASIATMTAIFVVNVRTEPEFIAWLLPSAVIIPLIIYWTRRTSSTACG